jgi:hypothetical protein
MLDHDRPLQSAVIVGFSADNHVWRMFDLSDAFRAKLRLVEGMTYLGRHKDQEYSNCHYYQLVQDSRLTIF